MPLANDVPTAISRPHKPTLDRAAKLFLRSMNMAGASAEEAVEFLRTYNRYQCYAGHEVPMPNLILMPGADPATTFDLDLKDISLLDATRYIALQADLNLRFDANAIVFSPRSKP